MRTGKLNRRNGISAAVVCLFLGIIVGMPGALRAVDYPGVASAPGANGTQWNSEVFLFNPEGSAITATLRLYPRGGSDAIAEKSYGMAAGESLSMEDLYSELGTGSGTPQS